MSATTFSPAAAPSRPREPKGRDMNWAGLLGTLAVSWVALASIGWLVLGA
ncbi:hypothetical protein [Teichococcus deserti]|nr:hypothetical protein [Pseudoroseomonas deserti]